jgi:hypothetical protein
MTTQHTPAPWSVEIDHHTAAPEFIRAYVDGEMYDLASVLCDETGNATANARLIAAAPDLLELARQVVLAADQNEGSIPADIVSGARDAIAKATGEAR